MISNDVSDELTIHSNSDNKTDDMDGTYTDDESFITIKTQITPNVLIIRNKAIITNCS